MRSTFLLFIQPFSTLCSIKPKSTWTLLKPSFETLVSSFVFPQLSFNATKQALWENDPVDYVRLSVGMSKRSTISLLSPPDVVRQTNMKISPPLFLLLQASCSLLQVIVQRLPSCLSSDLSTVCYDRMYPHIPAILIIKPNDAIIEMPLAHNGSGRLT